MSLTRRLSGLLGVSARARGECDARGIERRDAEHVLPVAVKRLRAKRADEENANPEEVCSADALGPEDAEIDETAKHTSYASSPRRPASPGARGPAPSLWMTAKSPGAKTRRRLAKGLWRTDLPFILRVRGAQARLRRRLRRPAGR